VRISGSPLRGRLRQPREAPNAPVEPGSGRYNVLIFHNAVSDIHGIGFVPHDSHPPNLFDTRRTHQTLGSPWQIWMVAYRESSELATKLIDNSCRNQGILRDQLTVHADNGSSTTSKPVAFLLSDPGVTGTHSHHHCGISMLTKSVLHHGDAATVIAQRQTALDLACARHPERFVKKPPSPCPAPQTVWINLISPVR